MHDKKKLKLGTKCTEDMFILQAVETTRHRNMLYYFNTWKGVDTPVLVHNVLHYAVRCSPKLEGRMLLHCESMLKLLKGRRVLTALHGKTNVSHFNDSIKGR